MRDGPLHAAATAEMYLAKGSPVVSLEQAMTLLRQAPYLPHAAQLGRLADRRGAERLPDLPHIQNLVWPGTQPRRARPESVANDPAARELDAHVPLLNFTPTPRDASATPTSSPRPLRHRATAQIPTPIALLDPYTQHA